MIVDVRKGFPKVYIKFQKWKQRVNDVSRFDNKNKLMTLLYDNVDLLSLQIEKGSKFFRGRIFDFYSKCSTESKYIKWLQEDTGFFDGLPKGECGAPPNVNSSEGRLNPKGISFLYTCSNEQTVVYELRPTKQEIISISIFETKKELIFADLTKKQIHCEGTDFEALLRCIVQEFAIPHRLGHTYYFTQYLAGQFVNMGFDGIVFDSSLIDGGKNYVFFNPKNVEAKNSYLCEVGQIYIDYFKTSRLNV